MAAIFTPIGTTTDRGFFSLEAFAGKLFAGTYGDPKAYVWNGQTFVQTGGAIGAAGESIFDMVRFSVDGKLYAVTESTGTVWRYNAGTDDWDLVLDLGAPWNNGYAIAEYQGYLFTAFNNFPDSDQTRFCRSPDGVTWATYDIGGGWNHVRGLVVFQGHLYALGCNAPPHTGSNQGRKITAPLNTDWSVQWTGVHTFSCAGVVFKGKLYGIVENDPDSGNKTAIVSWDGASLVTVFTTPAGDDQKIGSNGIVEHAGRLWAITGTAWRAASGTAKLYSSADGSTWVQEYAFSEPEGWSLAVYRNQLYAGTRQESGASGRVYRMAGGGGSQAQVV